MTLHVSFVVPAYNEEALLPRATRLGDGLRGRLEAVRPFVPQIAEVRGLGAMLAIEFQVPETGAAAPDFARRVQQLAMAQGLLLLTCGVYGNVIRFLMPLTTPDDVFAEGLDILERALRTAADRS